MYYVLVLTHSFGGELESGHITTARYITSRNDLSRNDTGNRLLSVTKRHHK